MEQKRSLITDIGGAVADLEGGLGVDKVEETLDELLGGTLTKVSSRLPQSTSPISSPLPNATPASPTHPVPRNQESQANNNPQLEDALGVTFAEKLLGLTDGKAKPGLLQSVGEAIGMILEGTGINDVNAFLDEATGGAITSLTEALGVDDIEAALGIIPAPEASSA